MLACCLQGKPLLDSGISSDRWNTRIILGIQRENDGMTIKVAPNGTVKAHLPGHDETLFTGQPPAAHEILSGIPETVLPVHPNHLIPLYSSEPSSISSLQERYGQGKKET